MNQIDIFSILYEKPIYTKPIKLIELFAGYGSQALAMKYLDIKYESHHICEWAVKSIQAYKDIHFNSDNTDYSKNLTDNEVINYLYEKGVSVNYNEPAKIEQIKRLNYRTIYNNIKATHNLVNIQQVHYKDLEIDNEYTHIMTYSFPCQDLSLAGKRAGMEKGSGTRSGLLWEVERILKERERENAIDVLLMENVPQVLTDKDSWLSWCDSLEQMGYVNYFKTINAKDYGIPQNRKRTFMISLYGGEKYYEYPKKIKLKYALKNLLEQNVEEKYYLSEKMIQYITADNDKWTGNNDKSIINKKIASALNTGEGSRRCDASNYISNDVGQNYDIKNKSLNETIEKNELKDGTFIDAYNRNVNDNVAGTITTRVSESNNTFIAIKNATKKGYLNAYDGDGIDLENGTRKGRRGTVQNGLAQTLKTQDNTGVVVIGNYSPSGHNVSRIVDTKGLSPTVMENHGTITGVVVKDSYVGTYNYAKSDRFIGNKDRLNKDNDVSETILASGNQAGGMLLGGIGDKKSNGETQYYYQDRVYNSDGIATAITTDIQPYYNQCLRIRKLTPKECFRLMGVLDSDYERVKQNQSNSSLYHLAGDSIVTTCLMALIGSLLGIDYKEKIESIVEQIKGE